MYAESRVWVADDPLTEKVANAIESRFPGLIDAVELVLAGETGRKVAEYDIVGAGFIVEVTGGKGPGKVKQVRRMARGNPTKAVPVYAPNPAFNPIAREELEAIVTGVGPVMVVSRIGDLLDALGAQPWRT